MSPDLIARYGRQRLPRYTSYPTAPRFNDGIAAQDESSWLGALPRNATGSLYLHVPYCRSMCWYCGCHTKITRHNAPIADYVDTLMREIDLVAACLARPLEIYHVHFGGGTPTIVAPDMFVTLMERLRQRFDFHPGAEIAIEIDPRTLTEPMIAALSASGVTRASLGVQTFDLAVQKAINRIQSFAVTAETTERLRAAGINNINFDLIYGLPLQTVESCLDTVERAISLHPQRFSVFGYAHVPAFKKHQRKIDEAALPDSAMRGLQEDAIAGALQAAGYVRIGLDHYALPDDSMAVSLAEGTLRRNFQGYTTDSSDALIGFGASAISRLPQGYLQNEVHLLRYAQAVEAGRLPVAKGYALSADDRLRADLIERVMCDFRVDLDRVLRAHRRPEEALEDVLPALRRLESDGVIRINGPVIEVADDARPLVRAVAAAFDAYLGADGAVHAPAV